MAIVDGPTEFDRTLRSLPADVTDRENLRGRGSFDVIVWFVDRAANLRRRFEGVAGRITENGGIWIAWPKKSSGVATEVGDALVREIGPALGLVDNKVCAIDQTWSGL